MNIFYLYLKHFFVVEFITQRGKRTAKFQLGDEELKMGKGEIESVLNDEQRIELLIIKANNLSII